MLTLLLTLLAYQPPDEYAILYGADMVWMQFSRYWEDCYDTSRSAYITAQGSHDMKHWYQNNRLKVELDFAKILSFRYRIDSKYDFEVAHHRHRVEPMLRIMPNSKALHGLRLHVFIAPLFQKKDDEMGAGISWTQDNRNNWIELHGVIEHFDHNNILRHIKQGPERNPYSKLPHRFELDARAKLPWLTARLHGELGTRSRQYLDWPDSTLEVWEKYTNRNMFTGRLELEPISGVCIGSRAYWHQQGSETRWRQKDSVFVDTLIEQWVSPYIAYSPTDRVELYIEHRFWDYYRNMDSLTYRRHFDVSTIQASWQPFDFMVFYAGYQYPWRERWVNDSIYPEPWGAGNAWPRLMLNFEYRAPSGFKFVVKEGLRMWNFPTEIFRRFHAHTYVQIYLPLGIVEKVVEKPSAD